MRIKTNKWQLLRVASLMIFTKRLCKIREENHAEYLLDSIWITNITCTRAYPIIPPIVKYQLSDVTPVSSLIQPRTSTTQMKALSFCTVYVTDQAVQHYYGLQSVLVNCKKLSQIQLNTVLANVWASWIQHGMNWRSHHVSCSMQQRPNDLTSTLPLLTDTWTGSVWWG